MDIRTSYKTPDLYVSAASDPQLSSSDNQLLTTLLSEEDQHDYNQIIKTQLSSHTFQLIMDVASFLHISSSAIWMSIIFTKKLIQQQYSIDILTIIASLTLASKYQDSSSPLINYQLILQHYPIDDIQQIHNAENQLLEIFDYDICVTTPDHFFSYLINLVKDDEHNLRQTIQQARSLFSMTLLSNEISELFCNYPSSIVTLSFIYKILSNKSFIIEQMKTFLLHKKDSTHYFTQLLHCTAQVQSMTS